MKDEEKEADHYSKAITKLWHTTYNSIVDNIFKKTYRAQLNSLSSYRISQVPGIVKEICAHF